MKIAIHKREVSYSDGWIKYCEDQDISYKIVNCFDTNIVETLKDCDGLMWHWQHHDPFARLFARQLIRSLEKINFKVYPSSATAWHFDDKIGQKYLLEANSIPFIPTHIFYDKKEARTWAKSTNFPKVFKLSKGASALNVKLVQNYSQAKKLIKRAFSRGFLYSSRTARVKDDLLNLKKERNFQKFLRLLKGIVRVVFPKDVEKLFPKEKGYIYFQDFLPNNEFDIRVEVIGNRCSAMRRYNRKDDFRASGSGSWSFDPEAISKEVIEIAFKTAKKIKFTICCF